MQAKLYVGNLSYSVSEDDLRNLFAQYGEVKNVTIIRDTYSGQSKGFGFVEMASATDAEKALVQSGNPFMGRNLNVSEARPQNRDGGGSRSRSGGGYGGGGGGGGRDGGRRPRY